MDRRDFLKALGLFASMPFMSKLKFLNREPVREGIASVADKGIEFYNAVIQKVIREGKKIKESDRVETYVHPDRPDIRVDVDQSTGSSNVEFMTDRDTKGFAEIDVTMDEATKGARVEELKEAEEVYRTTPSGEDYYKDVEEGIMGGTKNLEEFLGRKKKKDGGIMELTIMQIPDIEVKGVESLFKAR